MDLKKLEKKAAKTGISEVGLWLSAKYGSAVSLLEGHQNHLRKMYKTCGTKYSGEATTSGGAASEDISIPGLKASNRCQVSMKEQGSTPVTILSAKCDADKITVTYSADPGSDHVVTYSVI